VDTGWVGYLRGDYRTGDGIEGWSVSGGVRYQFVPAPAAGGRTPVIAKAPVYKAPPAQSAYNWAGFYTGAYLGADWGNTNWTFADGSSIDPHFAGLLGGGEMATIIKLGNGCSVSKVTLARPVLAAFDPVRAASSTTGKSTSIGCPRTRVGYAYWDRLLAYAKVGAVTGGGSVRL
jgi:opacity protein-like surface antigen